VTDATWRVIEGDCTERMRELEPASIDAVVCDPPYGLEFMGKEWDRLQAVAADPATLGGFQDGAGGNSFSRARVRYALGPGMQEWHAAWALEALRVLKPGGHLLAFGGTRTYHRLACALEDAGFEVRDCIAWLYGSGFPKSLDVSKAIDKAAGAAREDVYDGREPYDGPTSTYATGLGVGVVERRPVTPEAAAWQGWGTALKPAFEPIVVARKPLERTVAANVLAHGTGALNIDGTRIGMSDADAEAQLRGREAWAKSRREGRVGEPGQGSSLAVAITGDSRTGDEPVTVPAGRWPANVTLGHSPGCEPTGETRKVRDRGDYAASEWGRDEMWQGPEKRSDGASRGGTVRVWKCAPGCAVAMLDEQTGEAGGGFGTRGSTANAGAEQGLFGIRATGETVGYGDTGGASRFFYCPKADREERNRGLEHMAQRPPVFGPEGEGALAGISHSSGARANHHPTVKPVELMRWLCRLVTPPHGTVLDPFTGSGTTGIAAMREGFSFVGIEREPEYAEIARARIIGDAPMFNSIAEVTA
jgi:DNA modification methylase